MKTITSPKGPFRLWGTGVVAVSLIVFIAITNAHPELLPFPLDGWVYKIVLNLSDMAVAGYAYYWMGRKFVHTRTHELTVSQKAIRENVLMVGLAFLIGCALL